MTKQINLGNGPLLHPFAVTASAGALKSATAGSSENTEMRNFFRLLSARAQTND